MLSTAERVSFLKGVSLFERMTAGQAPAVAALCEEAFFPAETRIVEQGAVGGVLYLVVSGRVSIEQQRRPGVVVRLETIEPGAYFGEMTFFDRSACVAAAIALEDTLTLLIEREPLVALLRREPDLLLEMVTVLSRRLRQATNRIAELSRAHPRELHKLFDQL